MFGSTRRRFGPALAVGLAAGLAACDRVDVADLPPAREALAAVGKRLGRERKPGDLTAMAGHADRVLKALNRGERAALGRDALRFRVDRPVVVEVAALASTPAPFWLADQGFRRAGLVHDADGAAFALWSKGYAAGAVGLGVNALDRSSPAHYAVFVRAADGPGGRPVIAAIGPDVVATRPAGRDVSPFEDVHRPLVDLPEGTADGLVVLTRQADRADGALLPLGRAWKSRQPSGAAPDQVVASFGGDPARELSISWRTDPTVVRSRARFRPDARAEPIAFDGVAEPIDSDGLLNDPTILRHKVRATGLRPDTRYEYAVGDGSDAGWSRWYATRTAPAADAPRDYGFLYLGDAQCELERWGELAHAAVHSRPDAGFLVLAGDLVDRGNERSNWDHFLLRAVGVFDAIPFMPAVGNHEYLDKGPVIYRRTFDLPKDGPAGMDPNLVYSFEYADAFVAVLDSNPAIYDPEAARLQAAWLDAKLARTRATWKFVAFHHPIYASHPKRANPQLGAVWCPVFDRHHVDMVLTGHDHAYLRSKPMRAGLPVDDPADGTVYVVSVSGEKFYGQEPHDFTAKGMTRVATYQTIDVEVASRRLRYRSFDRDGREVDALTIQKPAPVGPASGELTTAVRE